MRMSMTISDDSNHFLNKQKHEYTAQNPQTHCGLVSMIVVATRRMRIDTALMVVIVIVMVVWGQRVWDQVQERVTQQSAGGKT